MIYPSCRRPAGVRVEDAVGVDGKVKPVGIPFAEGISIHSALWSALRPVHIDIRACTMRIRLNRWP